MLFFKNQKESTTYFTIGNKLIAVGKYLGSIQTYKIVHFLVLIGFIFLCLIEKYSLPRSKAVLMFKNVLFSISLLDKISKNVVFNSQYS